MSQGATWRGGQLTATTRSSGAIEEHSALNKKWKNSVIVEKGLVVDNLAKTLITKLIPITRKHFCIKDAGIFRERFLKNGRLAVVVEHPDNKEYEVTPDWRWVSQIDGRVMVLESALDYDPREGACVAILLGIDRHFFGEQLLELQDKDRYRWI